MVKVFEFEGEKYVKLEDYDKARKEHERLMVHAKNAVERLLNNDVPYGDVLNRVVKSQPSFGRNNK